MKTSPQETHIDTLKHTNLMQKQADNIRNRLFLLEGRDKIMMSMFVDNGISYRQIALLLGICPSSVSRKIRKITKELTQGIYISCMKKSDKFTPGEIAIAKDYFVKGLSIKQIAKRENISFYEMREKIKEIRHIAEKTKRENK